VEDLATVVVEEAAAGAVATNRPDLLRDVAAKVAEATLQAHPLNRKPRTALHLSTSLTMKPVKIYQLDHELNANLSKGHSRTTMIYTAADLDHLLDDTSPRIEQHHPRQKRRTIPTDIIHKVQADEIGIMVHHLREDALARQPEDDPDQPHAGGQDLPPSIHLLHLDQNTKTHPDLSIVLSKVYWTILYSMRNHPQHR
jgi:hypothetical protein